MILKRKKRCRVHTLHRHGTNVGVDGPKIQVKMLTSSIRTIPVLSDVVN